MLDLSVPLVSWSFEDLMNQEQSGREILETIPDESLFQFPRISDEFVKILGEFDEHNTNMDKKLNHNASERDRRKKINDMYASLRSILPTTDSDTKMLSIPSTIARALKYIPELQREVEILNQKKDELKLRVDKCSGNEHIENGQVTKKQKRTEINGFSSGVVSVNTLGDGDEEVLIQLCIDNEKNQKNRLSEILKTLEEEGLLLLNMSCLESFGKVFHNLHLQVQETQRMNVIGSKPMKEALNLLGYKRPTLLLLATISICIMFIIITADLQPLGCPFGGDAQPPISA